MVGSRLLQYEITAKLGEGGMDAVYAAEDTKLRRQVVLKVLPPEIAGSPERLKRFEREAQALAALNHPSIVTIHSVEQSDGVHFLTMELVEGETLGELIPQDGMKREEFFAIATPLAGALAAAHDRGITHRDLKPANIMVTGDGEVKILGFGLARVMGGGDFEADDGAETQLETEALTEEGMILGTVPYMSPEQVSGKPVDHRTDIFSLGVIFYEMATGRRPFQGENSVTLSGAIVHFDPPQVSEVRGELPSHLARIIRRCLEKEPDRRYQTVRDIRNDIDRFAEDLQTGQLSTIGSVAPMSPARPVVRRWLVAAAGVVVLSLLGLFVWQRSGEDRASAVPAVELVDNRIVVAVFENRTSDPALEALGTRIADNLVAALSSIEPENDPLGLGEMRELDVQTPRTLPDTGGVDRVTALARQTGSRYVVSGTIFPRQAGLQISWRMTDAADNSILWSADETSASRSNLAAAVEEVVERVKGFTASGIAWNDFDLKNWQAFNHRPPRYQAYREMAAGWQVFDQQNDLVVEHVQRAMEIDPEFVEPHFVMMAALQNRGRWPESDAIFDDLVARLDELPLGYALSIRIGLAGDEGNREKQFELGLRRAEFSRSPPTIFMLQRKGLSLRRVQWVVDSFPDVDIWTFSWHNYVMTDAHHALGNYDKEIEISRESRERYPEHLWGWVGELRALAATGRIAELEAALDEIEASEGTSNAGDIFAGVAEALRAHGERDASLRVAERAIVWWEAQPADVRAEEGARRGLAYALYVSERWAAAGEIYAELLAAPVEASGDDSEDHRHRLNRLIRSGSALGTVAARLGDQEEARQWFERLDLQGEEIDLTSRALQERAKIAALLGEKESVVDLLRQAFGLGLGWSHRFRHDMDFESMQGYEPWEELIRLRD